MRASRPFGQRVFHLFPDDDTRSLCGRLGIMFPDPDQFEPVTADTTWVRGQDCKTCWRKAGQPIAEVERR